MSTLPLFPVTTVGSWPRPDSLLRAQRLNRQGKLSDEEFNAQADDAVLNFLRLQEDAGVDVVTDGEQRRDNFSSFVAEKLSGVRLFTLAELMDIFEDKAGFERILQTLDVPAYSISNATCVGKVKRDRPLAADDVRFLRQHTDLPIKATLPGPYLLTRALYVPETARATYPTKEDLGEDIVRVLREEVEELVAEGTDFIQFDEPVLTELVFTQGMARTFMCATLAASKDPSEELEFAVSLMSRVMEGIDAERVGVHVCRGNWSRNEETLLRGSYSPLQPYLDRMPVKQLVLEYATERAGDALAFEGKELGLGVVNPRTERVESVQEIRSEVREAAKLYPPEHIWLNPDCGFGTFANRPMNREEIAQAKLKAMVEAARSLREGLG
jgi:5-methyltetrahydropteroyltriglutamate--homocysteine methyltransferase